MSSDPYQSPQGYADSGAPAEAPNPTGMILGIVSIVTGVLGIFPGCCCALVAVPMGLISIGTGVGGLLTADPRQPIGKILSIIGIVLGALGILWIVFALVLNAAGVIDPNQFQQFEDF